MSVSGLRSKNDCIVYSTANLGSVLLSINYFPMCKRHEVASLPLLLQLNTTATATTTTTTTTTTTSATTTTTNLTTINVQLSMCNAQLFCFDLTRKIKKSPL